MWMITQVVLVYTELRELTQVLAFTLLTEQVLAFTLMELTQVLAFTLLTEQVLAFTLVELTQVLAFTLRELTQALWLELTQVLA